MLRLSVRSDTVPPRAPLDITYNLVDKFFVVVVCLAFSVADTLFLLRLIFLLILLFVLIPPLFFLPLLSNTLWQICLRLL